MSDNLYKNTNIVIRKEQPEFGQQIVPHDTVDHMFSVTFFGEEYRKLYKFRVYCSDFFGADGGSPKGEIYDYVELINPNVQICETKMLSPLFNIGDTVWVPQTNTSYQITGIERSIEDGSYRVHIGKPRYKIIEDERTKETYEEAQKDLQDYQEEKDKESKKDKELMDLLKKRDTWNRSHNWIYKLFVNNPYNFDPRIMKFDQEIEK